MIRVAVCGRRREDRIYLRGAVERYAASVSIRNIEVMQFATPAALEEAVANARVGYFDLCFMRVDGAEVSPVAGIVTRKGAAALQDDASAAGVAARLRAENPDMRMVIVSDDKAVAMLSYDLEAGFLLLSDSYDDFVRVVSGPLDCISGERGATATMKSNGVVENVVLADVQFVESSKRGPIIHFPAGRTLRVRGTLQTLFDSLSGVELPGEGDQAAAPRHAPETRGSRFVKAGSSFIVNLDNVRSFGDGVLVFADGEAIIVPVRKRKAILDALESYQLREIPAD